MTIIFNQYAYVENLLKNDISKKLKQEDLTKIAMYYREKGLIDFEIREILLNHCKKFNPDYNEVLGARVLDNALMWSKKEN